MGKKGVLTPGQQRLAFPPAPTPADSQSAESKGPAPAKATAQGGKAKAANKAKTKQSSGKASAVAKAQAGKAAKVKAKAKAAKALAAKAKAKAKAAKQAKGPAQAKAKRQEQSLEANASSAKKAKNEPTALDGTTDGGREAGGLASLAEEPKLAAAPALPKKTGSGEACNPEPSKMEEVPVAAAVVIHNEAQDARSKEAEDHCLKSGADVESLPAASPVCLIPLPRLPPLREEEEEAVTASAPTPNVPNTALVAPSSTPLADLADQAPSPIPKKEDELEQELCEESSCTDDAEMEPEFEEVEERSLLQKTPDPVSDADSERTWTLGEHLAREAAGTLVALESQQGPLSAASPSCDADFTALPHKLLPLSPKPLPQSLKQIEGLKDDKSKVAIAHTASQAGGPKLDMAEDCPITTEETDQPSQALVLPAASQALPAASQKIDPQQDFSKAEASNLSGPSDEGGQLVVCDAQECPEALLAAAVPAASQVAPATLQTFLHLEQELDKQESPASKASLAASSPKTPPRKKQRPFQPLDQAIFDMVEQLDAAAEMADEERDNLFHKAERACKQHPAFFLWKAGIEAEIGQDDLEEDEQWVPFEQEPDEDLHSFLDYLMKHDSMKSPQAATPDATTPLAELLQQVRRGQQCSPDSWEDSDKEVLSPCLERLFKPAGFENSFMWRYLQEVWPTLSRGQRRRIEHNVQKNSHAHSHWPSLATFCSGSGMAELAHRCLTASLNASEDFLFSCEKESFKARHLCQNVHPIMLRDRLSATASARKEPCLFQDMVEVVNGAGHCIVHKQTCKLDEERCPTLLCAGYSCKNLSKLNCNPKEFVLRSATGSSGETAQALLKYLNDWRPAVALLENVEEMAREADESDNVSYFLEELDKLGYAMATKLLDSSHYGVAAIRRRAWQVVLNRSAFQSDNKELDKAAQDIVQMACGLAIGSWPLEDFLLSNDHDLVQQEFQRRVQTSGKGSIAAQEGWKAKHREFFQSKGIPWTAVQVPAAVRESPWYVFLTEREREVLAWGLMCADQKKAKAQANAERCPEETWAAKYVAVDVSQRLDRCRISLDKNLFTMLPGQKVFLLAYGANGLDEKVGAGRLLLGEEALRLQAFHGPVNCSDPQKQDLAGNAFSGTVVLALLLSLYANLPEYAWTDDDLPPVAKMRKAKVVLGAEDIARVCRKLNFEDSDSD